VYEADGSSQGEQKRPEHFSQCREIALKPAAEPKFIFKNK
jgi:hypothetical protein